MKKLLTVLLAFLLLLAYGDTYSQDKSNLSQSLLEVISNGATQKGRVGAVVKSLKTGEYLFHYHPYDLFVPASNMKVVISAAALSILKPEYKFRTEFYAGEKVADGIIYGDLYIKGYGDPVVTTEKLWFMANEIKKLGIKEIRGGVVVDESFFDGVRSGPGWKKEWLGRNYSPSISALSLNFNTYEIKVLPGGVGQRPRVVVDPPGTNVTLINEAVTGKGKNNISVRKLEGSKTVVIRGTIPRSSKGKTFRFTVDEPALYTGSVFRTLLESMGIRVANKLVRSERASYGVEPLYTYFSDPLQIIITLYNKWSINMIGENIIKTLGAETRGVPGSWEKGAQVVTEFLYSLGLREGFNIVDGSGLSPINQLSPYVLAEVLRYAHNNSSIGPEFISSLSVGGIDGTLRKRFKEPDIVRKVRAKTGYLSNISCISGYVFTDAGDILAVSILTNGISGWRAKTIQNDFLGKLVECCETNGEIR